MLRPPPSAPAYARRDPRKSAFLQQVLEQEQERQRREQQATALLRTPSAPAQHGGVCVDVDNKDTVVSTVLSNYDLRQIVVSYI